MAKLAWKLGEVVWFDEDSGKGLVVDKKNGESFYVNYSSIESNKKWKTLKPGSEVKYQSRPSLYANILTKVKEISQ
ncbi:MAG: cold shock domain-containing protein [Halobacteriovoraceae bacterium]|nr:cold shock domain-containing protein [Halobacteriovoraceae bacterium]